MHFTRGDFSGGDNLAFAINTAVNLILKLGFTFAAAGYGSIRIGGGDIFFVGGTGFSNRMVIGF